MTNEFAQFGVDDTHRRVSYPVSDTFYFFPAIVNRHNSLLVAATYLDHHLRSVL